MNVKVKAKILLEHDYSGNEILNVRYVYKAEGFKKYSNYITLIYKTSHEYDYQDRLLKELRLLTREEVVQDLKDAIIKSLKFRIASSTHEDEKKRLLKELNGIKFNFTIKERL